jgi:hypothetical protein
MRTPYPTPAPNLTSPAPTATIGFPLATSKGQCILMPIRTEHVRPSELIDVLGQQVPTRLPAGANEVECYLLPPLAIHFDDRPFDDESSPPAVVSLDPIKRLDHIEDVRIVALAADFSQHVER